MQELPYLPIPLPLHNRHQTRRALLTIPRPHLPHHLPPLLAHLRHIRNDEPRTKAPHLAPPLAQLLRLTRRHHVQRGLAHPIRHLILPRKLAPAIPLQRQTAQLARHVHHARVAAPLQQRHKRLRHQRCRARVRLERVPQLRPQIRAQRRPADARVVDQHVQAAVGVGDVPNDRGDGARGGHFQVEQRDGGAAGQVAGAEVLESGGAFGWVARGEDDVVGRWRQRRQGRGGVEADAGVGT